MGEQGYHSQSKGAILQKTGWMFAALAVAGALAVFLWARIERGSEGFEGEGAPYGFSGEVYRFGRANHEIVFGSDVSQSVIESLGDYLEQIGYFSPAYGGVIQIRSIEGGFHVYLTYSREYWELPDFREEVASIRDDLEANVLMARTQIVLVDEDEDGIHSMNLDGELNAS